MSVRVSESRLHTHRNHLVDKEWVEEQEEEEQEEVRGPH